jgi:UDP-N-acetylglucosamine acyltransferase
MEIHRTAIVHPKAKLADSVIIGPFTLIGENVVIKDNTRIGTHCSIEGWTAVGRDNQIFNGTVIGSPPQDLKYKGERSFIEIGDNNIIREYVTINPGTALDEKTVIGNNNLLMAYSHVAHNCIIANNTIVANGGTLAGHVIIEDKAIIGGLVAIHQFARVGKLSIVGGCSKVVQDIPPFSMCDGHPAKVYSLNYVGLKRAGVPKIDCLNLKRAFKIIFFSNLSLKSAITQVEQEIPNAELIPYLINFIKNSKRGLSKRCKESD